MTALAHRWRFAARWSGPSIAAARRLVRLALQPNALHVKPLTRVRHCEHALRCWLRGESGAHIENAIAQLHHQRAPETEPTQESAEASRHV